MSTQASPVFREGDVVSYRSKSGRHCREEVAVTRADGRLVDTYWRPRGDNDSHVLTAGEVETAQVLFNLDDGWNALTSHREHTWAEHALADRQVIPSQHGLRKVFFLREGAQPDLSTKIANAEKRLAAAQAETEAAQRAVMWAEEALELLISQRDAS